MAWRGAAQGLPRSRAPSWLSFAALAHAPLSSALKGGEERRVQVRGGERDGGEIRLESGGEVCRAGGAGHRSGHRGCKDRCVPLG